MSLLQLIEALVSLGETVVYKGDCFIITSAGRRYYRTNVRLNPHDGLMWAEDGFYRLQATRIQGVMQ